MGVEGVGGVGVWVWGVGVWGLYSYQFTAANFLTNITEPHPHIWAPGDCLT